MKKSPQERRLQWHSSLESVFLFKENWVFVETLNQIDFKLEFSLFSFSLCPPPFLALPALSSLVFLPLTCIALYQPLPFSAAGVGEGEGKPGGADRALFQGAPGTGRLWQHKECCNTCTDVSETAVLTPLRTRSILFLWFVVDVFTKPEGGMHFLMLFSGIVISAPIGLWERDKVNARLYSCFWLDVSAWFADGRFKLYITAFM